MTNIFFYAAHMGFHLIGDPYFEFIRVLEEFHEFHIEFHGYIQVKT